ncbi:hypothetical protein ACVWWO_003665 [Bradyrhizobium sp. F1.13.1]
MASETTSGELLVNCDQTQFQQVIINLALNAMDAMSAVPAVTRKISISTTRVENFADVIVSDTGPGISADMFEICVRALFLDEATRHGNGIVHCPQYSGSPWRSDLDRGQDRDWRGFSHPSTAARRFSSRIAPSPCAKSTLC